MAETPSEAANEVATGKIKKSRDNLGNEAEYFAPEDILDASRHETAQKAAKKPLFGLRLTRMIPPGTG